MDGIAKPFRKLSRQMTDHFRQNVVEFNDGTVDDVDLLGLKGANLCVMRHLGLPVPPGFIITTSAFHEYADNGWEITEYLEDSYRMGVNGIEADSHKKFGGSSPRMPTPLLLSVRSSPVQKMPGQLHSVLNVGMNDAVVDLLSESTGRHRHFAIDTYRRFLYHYGTIVNKVDSQLFDDILARARKSDGVSCDSKLSTHALLHVVEEFKRISHVPEDPYDQLKAVIEALFRSWEDERIVNYRNAEAIAHTSGLAIVVQQMVFGNLNSRSGTGIAVAANSLRGGNDHIRGEYVRRGEGEEAIDGSSPSLGIREVDPDSYDKLEECFEKLQAEYNQDIQYVEFTIQDGELYILETSAVKMLPRVTDEGLVYVVDAEEFR